MNLNRVFRVLLTVLVSICAAMPGTALGQVHDHEEGFFLRLSAGGGGASTEVTGNGVTVKCSGPAGDVNFAIGGIVSPNLALHGTIFGWTITDPEVKVSNLSGNLEGELTLSGIGAGLTYYFMPANLYISGTLGVGRLELRKTRLFDGTSDAGLMADVTIGKEWWVGDQWGIGVALGLGLHSVPDEGSSDNWSGGSVGVRFTATMN